MRAAYATSGTTAAGTASEQYTCRSHQFRDPCTSYGSHAACCYTLPTPTSFFFVAYYVRTQFNSLCGSKSWPKTDNNDWYESCAPPTHRRPAKGGACLELANSGFQRTPQLHACQALCHVGVYRHHAPPPLLMGADQKRWAHQYPKDNQPMSRILKPTSPKELS